MFGHTLGTPEHSLEEALSLFQTVNLDGAEVIWQNDYPAAIPETEGPAGLRKARLIAEDLGVPITALTPYVTGINSLDDRELEADIQRFHRCIDAAQQLGASHIRVYAGSYSPDEHLVHAEKWSRLVDSLRRLGTVASAAGVMLCVENHFNTMTMTAAETRDLVVEVGSDGVGILYDQANLSFTHSEDFEEAIELQGRWISHAHVKDFTFLDSDRPFSASAVHQVSGSERAIRSEVVGDGELPWPDILARLIGAGFKGALSLEYEYRWHAADLPPPEVGFDLSAKRVRSILRDLEQE